MGRPANRAHEMVLRSVPTYQKDARTRRRPDSSMRRDGLDAGCCSAPPRRWRQRDEAHWLRSWSRLDDDRDARHRQLVLDCERRARLWSGVRHLHFDGRHHVGGRKRVSVQRLGTDRKNREKNDGVNAHACHDSTRSSSRAKQSHTRQERVLVTLRCRSTVGGPEMCPRLLGTLRQPVAVGTKRAGSLRTSTHTHRRSPRFGNAP